jgi:glycosyltransferase involved in cell wall biosynthesis
MSVRLALLTEIIAPYRIPVFNALAQQQGIDLHVVFLAETDPTQRQWLVYKDEIGFSYEVLPSWRGRCRGWHVLLNRGMEAALEHFRPNSILCGGYNHPAFWQALIWAKFHGTHFSAWVESTIQDQRSPVPLLGFMKEQFVRNCSSFVVPGRSSFEYVKFMGVPAERIHRAPNAVDIKRFARLAASVRERQSEWRTELGLPPRYFLCAGRIIAEKGVFYLLEAYSRLAPEVRSQVGLVFVGEGIAKSELMKIAGKVNPGRVVFAGFAQRDQLAAFYALAEALVFPTLSDPWGLVVNEAMACGLPIIATSVAGCTADLVEDGKNGYLVPAMNVEKLVEAMSVLACDMQLASVMGKRSQEIIQGFSPELCAAGLAEAVRPHSAVQRTG